MMKMHCFPSLFRHRWPATRVAPPTSEVTVIPKDTTQEPVCKFRMKTPGRFSSCHPCPPPEYRGRETESRTLVLMPLLEIKNLLIEFAASGGRHTVVDDLSLDIAAGQTLCLVGESGCGKSVTALSIARLLPTPPASFPCGQILFESRDVLKMSSRELRELRGGSVSYIFQEPGASLNPVIRIGAQIKETLWLHKPQNATDQYAGELLEQVGIADPVSRLRSYPFELSGGMQQRAMIAIALASHPKLLVADEPTTALDVTIQAQILDLLRELKARLGMSILLITHNLGIVGGIADRVAVMYAGQIVEAAPARELLRRPAHPYTKALIDSVPQLRATNHRLATIPGTVPRAGEITAGCRFAPRCSIARSECATTPPELVQIDADRSVRCPYWKEVLPS
jgi:peptide/nickel transport system ATP-binding protein